MSESNPDAAMAIELFKSIIVDADLRNIVRKDIYPHHLAIGLANIHFVEKTIRKLVYELGRTVWVHLPDELVEHYGMSSNLIRLTDTSCKSMGLSEDSSLFMMEISINRKLTVVEVPITVFNKVHVEAPDGRGLVLEGILQGALTKLISEFSEMDPTKLGDLMDDRPDNVVKVDFGNKSKIVH